MAWTILVQSTLMAIPIYSMKSAADPKSIMEELELFVGIFFFCGECGDERKIHTIKWSKICLPKQHGGLGLPCLRLSDQSCALREGEIEKNIPTNSNLCSQILREKCGQWELEENRRRGGLLRKGICWN